MNISSIVLTENKLAKQESRERIGAKTYDVHKKTKRFMGFIERLPSMPLSALDRKVKYGQDLSFEEAFCGMCYVLAATNKLIFQVIKPYLFKAYGSHFSEEKAVPMGTAFLNLMACKESMRSLTSDEVAGMAAAGYMDKIFDFEEFDRVVETCGMGGDKGFLCLDVRLKSINVSTLSSLVLASMKVPCVKHGSYGNTSAVGSTDCLDLFGANTSFDDYDQLVRVYKKSGYCFFDAHLSKTLHDLSHLLMMETVNHVLGPFTPPISSTVEINKVMGVNEKMDPETVAQAYAILHQREIQNVGGVIVVAGIGPNATINLDDHPNRKQRIRDVTVSDELSPCGSVLAVTHRGDYLGVDFLEMEDFGVKIKLEDILISQDRHNVSVANMRTLQGLNPALVDYLAVNAALGFFLMKYMDRLDAYKCHGLDQVRLNRNYLKQCFKTCKQAILSGRALATLKKYVETTGGSLALQD